ncbi:MAG: hypothetical protein WDW38_005041 [Sanguina aurantia]
MRDSRRHPPVDLPLTQQPTNDDSLPAIRANSRPLPAFKASLKEPTRPTTPSDFKRQLFSPSSDYSQRPSSAYGAPSSKQFYTEAGPRLALPKLDQIGRPDTASRNRAESLLSYAPTPAATSTFGSGRRTSALSTPSTTENGSFFGGSAVAEHPVGPWDPASRPLSSRGSRDLNSLQPLRQTPAEAVAALRLTLAATDPECRPSSAELQQQQQSQRAQQQQHQPRYTHQQSHTQHQHQQQTSHEHAWQQQSQQAQHQGPQPQQEYSQQQHHQHQLQSTHSPDRPSSSSSTSLPNINRASPHVPQPSLFSASLADALALSISSGSCPTHHAAASQADVTEAEGYGDSPPTTPPRNDDLPPRPGTSRGRPSSSVALLPEPAATPAEVRAMPPPTEYGNGAQVLDLALLPAEASDASDEDEPEDSNAHSAVPARIASTAMQEAGAFVRGRSGGYAAAAAQPSLLAAGFTRSSVQQQQQHSASGIGGSDSLPEPPPALRPPPSGSRSSGRQEGGIGGGSPVHCQQNHPMRRDSTDSDSQMPAEPASSPASSWPGGAGAGGVSVEPSDPLDVWRRGVDATLTKLSSVQHLPPALLREVTHLTGHVEVLRRQADSSSWLNAQSPSHRDSAGVCLNMREAICEHVFELMDSPNAEILMKACSVVLRVVKSRTPLLQAAKVLYRLSKDTGNDALFKREGLLEPMLSTVHVMVLHSSSGGGTSMHEPLIFLNGCLKNVSNDGANQKTLVRLGAVHVLSLLLAHLAQQADSDPKHMESCSQVAVQASGVLRNLAVSPPHAAAFLRTAALPALCTTLRVMAPQPEVVLNSARTLSKLSLHEGCHAAMEADGQWVPLLATLMARYACHRAILLRIAFVLGNLTTQSRACREQMAALPGALDSVVSILHTLATPPPTPRPPPPPHPPLIARPPRRHPCPQNRSSSREECLVKLLRLLANLSIHPAAGRALAARPEVSAALLSTLEQFGGCSGLDVTPGGGPLPSTGGGVDASSQDRHEELVLNCCSALTNLSFYQGAGNQVLAMPPASLLRHITPLLMGDNDEAIVEAARLYGNLSLQPQVRVYMASSRVVEALLLLLDHSSGEVLFAVCGSLINFTVDTHAKGALIAVGGAGRLISTLDRLISSALPLSHDTACAGQHSLLPTSQTSDTLGDAQEGASGDAQQGGGWDPGGASDSGTAQTLMQLGDYELGTLVGVCKALYNICASGFSQGKQGGVDCVSEGSGKVGLGGGSDSSSDHSGGGDGDGLRTTLTPGELDMLYVILGVMNGDGGKEEGWDEARRVATRLGERVEVLRAAQAPQEWEILP